MNLITESIVTIDIIALIMVVTMLITDLSLDQVDPGEVKGTKLRILKYPNPKVSSTRRVVSAVIVFVSLDNTYSQFF